MDAILEECRKRFGEPPRSFTWWDRWSWNRLRTMRPAWCTPEDSLYTFFQNRDELQRNGVIVLAHLVQANSELFEPGYADLPGDVVYCLDPDRDISLGELARIARALFALKSKNVPDPEEQRIGDHLANELTRSFGWPVPASISPDLPCATSTIFITREHLPGERLQNVFFPLLLMPKEPRVAMPLPSRYWPPHFARSWQRE